MRDVGVRVEKDIRYSRRTAGAACSTSTCRPRATTWRTRPVLLQVHGGGWTIGNKDQQGIPLMQHLAAKGWVCVAINYRLAPRDPFPAHIVDVKQAIAWIREHIAEYGGDPDYIAITGGSAGGHLTALAALTPNDPAYQPGFEDADTTRRRPPSRTTASTTSPASTGLRSAELMRDQFLRRGSSRRRWADAREVFEAASPILRVTADAPDFFVLHGVHDTLVSVEQARLFVERLRETSQARRSSTPSCPAPSTPSTSSPRSGPPTSSARSTATCTGTGTLAGGHSLRRVPTQVTSPG